MTHDVFISYSSEDKKVADAICGILESNAIRCWIAPRDVQPGIEYAASIVDGITTSRIMVLVFSSHANASTHVSREVERAVHNGLHIVSFRIEDIEMSKSLEYFISSTHWLDALTPPMKSHIERLAEAVRFLLDTPSSTQPEDSGIQIKDLSADKVQDELLKLITSKKNAILTGPPGLNKQEFISDFLNSNKASLKSDVMDMLYVRDFHHPSRVTLLTLPAGEGIKFKNRMEEFSKELKNTLPMIANSEDFKFRYKRIIESYQESEMESRLVQFSQEVLSIVLENLIDYIKSDFQYPKISEYLDGAKRRMIELNGDDDCENNWQNKILKGSDELGVNLLVDNFELSDSPVVFEVTSSERNLIGFVEYDATGNRLPFMDIVPGALYRANGGILVLNGNDSYIQDHGLRTIKKAFVEKSLPSIPTTESHRLSLEQPEWNVFVLLYVEEKLISQLSKKEPELGNIFQTIIRII